MEVTWEENATVKITVVTEIRGKSTETEKVPFTLLNTMLYTLLGKTLLWELPKIDIYFFWIYLIIHVVFQLFQGYDKLNKFPKKTKNKKYLAAFWNLSLHPQNWTFKIQNIVVRHCNGSSASHQAGLFGLF